MTAAFPRILDRPAPPPPACCPSPTVHRRSSYCPRKLVTYFELESTGSNSSGVLLRLVWEIFKVFADGTGIDLRRLSISYRARRERIDQRNLIAGAKVCRLRSPSLLSVVVSVASRRRPLFFFVQWLTACHSDALFGYFYGTFQFPHSISLHVAIKCGISIQ